MSYNGPDEQYVDTSMKGVLKTKNDCLTMIVNVAADYDGHEDPDKLKKLIDEMAAYASYGRGLAE